MVNMWPGIPARCLCDKHLRAVHAEYLNLLLPSMRKGHSIYGYLLHGCVDLESAMFRHKGILREAILRGKVWKDIAPDDELDLISTYLSLYLLEHPELFTRSRNVEMAEMNKRVLAFRCPDCRKRMVDAKILIIQDPVADCRKHCPEPICQGCSANGRGDL